MIYYLIRMIIYTSNYFIYQYTLSYVKYIIDKIYSIICLMFYSQILSTLSNIMYLIYNIYLISNIYDNVYYQL